jgi:hypothetical protein
MSNLTDENGVSKRSHTRGQNLLTTKFSENCGSSRILIFLLKISANMKVLIIGSL